jgi:hypothetical protein
LSRHDFSRKIDQFIREQLRLGGTFWSAFETLPFDKGQTFAFLPPSFPADLACRVDEALLGHYEDQTSFEEEYDYIRKFLNSKSDHAVIFGFDQRSRSNKVQSQRFDILTLRPPVTEGYSSLVVLTGATADDDAIRDAMILAQCPFLCGALIESDQPEPLDFIASATSSSDVSQLVQRAVGVIVEAYRGEGSIFWRAPGRT